VRIHHTRPHSDAGINRAGKGRSDGAAGSAQGPPDRTVRPAPGARNRPSSQSAPEPAVGAYRTLAPVAVASAALAFYAPQLADTALTDAVDQAGQLITTLHSYRWPLAVLAAAWIAVDILRWRGHRQGLALEAQLRQTTRHLPVKVTVAFPPGIGALRSAKIGLPRGAIIRPKEMDEFTTAVRGAAGRTGTHTYTVRHHAHRDLILITRTPIEPDTRSPRHKARQTALSAGTIFKEPAVTVDACDDDGIEIGYKITFTPSEGYLVMYLRAPLPTRVDHPPPWSTRTSATCPTPPAQRTSACTGMSRPNRTNRTA
jgi:hypothetical protein